MIMKCTIAAAILFLMVCSAGAAEISGSVGATSQGGATARVGVGLGWDKRWFESDTGRLTGYWDAGYTYWEAGDAAGGAHSLSFAPVFVYEFGNSKYKTFVEAGIGVAVFSGASAGDQKLGSPFSFEDRIGAGVKIGEAQRVWVSPCCLSS